MQRPKTAALWAATAWSCLAGTAGALPLERDPFDPTILFSEGDRLQFEFNTFDPDVRGDQLVTLAPGSVAGTSSGDIIGRENSLRSTLKWDQTERLSFAIELSQPYVSDIAYPTGTGFYTQGTSATLDTDALTFMGNYDFGNGFSAHGGLRVQRIEATTAVPALGNYRVESDRDMALGWALGVSWERPERAQRVTLTYTSAIDHDVGITESILSPLGPVTQRSETTFRTPDAISLYAQTGITPRTLVFARARYVGVTDTVSDPQLFVGTTGRPILDYDENAWNLQLGVGYRVNERLGLLGAIVYEDEADENVGQFGPTSGQKGIAVGARYDFGAVEVSGIVAYSRAGDATVTNANGQPRARFEDVDATRVTLGVTYKF